MKLFLKIIAIVLFPFMIGKAVLMNDGNPNRIDFVFTSNLYPEHIAGAYTGGFGEQSCHSCHFDYDLNQSEGELVFSGVEDTFEPGKKYTLQLHVKRDDMNRAGFQMSARFKGGSQAGQFELPEDLTTTPGIENKVSYIQHGVGKVEAESGEKNWSITWIAPDQSQPVIFNIAANAANGDASEFGDWIYLKEIEVEPQQ